MQPKCTIVWFLFVPVALKAMLSIIQAALEQSLKGGHGEFLAGDESQESTDCPAPLSEEKAFNPLRKGIFKH